MFNLASFHRPESRTVRDAINLFIADKRRRVAAGAYDEKSLETLLPTLTDFANAYGDKTVDQCGNGDLITWILAHETWASPHTLLHRMGMVVAAFRWAASRGIIRDCPFRRVPDLWPSPQPRQAIKPEEYRAIMQAARVGPYRVLTHRPRCKPPEQPTRYAKQHLHRPTSRAFRMALFMLWQTGCRTCEMKTARWADLDFDKGVIILAEHKTARATGHARIIALSRPLLRLLRWRWRRLRPKPADLICMNGRGSPWTNGTFGRAFRKRAGEAGVRACVTAYSLRHGFCVRALEAGVGERQLADVMGHSSTRYIEWYGRSTRNNAEYLRGVLDDVNGEKGNERKDGAS